MRGSWLAALVSLGGCFVQQIDFDGSLRADEAVEFCEAAMPCGCQNSDAEHLSSLNVCTSAITRQIREIRDVGEAWELTRDDSCLQGHLHDIADLGCDWQGPRDDCERPCRLFHGDRTIGQGCTPSAMGLSNCAQGLSCNGICYDPCDPPPGPVGEGDALADGQPCTGHEQCASLHCPVGYCVPRPDLGEPCPAALCQRGLECIDDVCQAVDAPLCRSAFP